MDSRKIIRILKQNGWYEIAKVGSHTQFRHPKRKGRVTVPHPKKDIPIGTLKSIERQSGIKFSWGITMANYIAIVHKDTKSDFGVSFPDFPGCITAGKNIDEAKDMAQEALTLHIKGILEDGEKLPHPSRLEEIMIDPGYVNAVAYLVVSVPDAKPRTVRVNVTVPEMTLKQIDAAAKKRGMSRSSFLVHAAQNAIQSIQSDVPAWPFPAG
jgi:predicted RNA binding protein YcfA (HicA-like mRNA interferase family)/predicted RNase H-like HicB family nuclease